MEIDWRTIIQIRIATAVVFSKREGHQQIGNKWIKTLARNLSTQRKASEKDKKKESEKMQKKLEVVEREISDERKFNQDR